MRKTSKIEVPERPYHFSWDLTTACLLKCIFCYSASGEPHKAETRALVDLVLDNVVELHPLHLGIGGGEPLVSPYISYALEGLVNSMGKDTPVTTIDSMAIYNHEEIVRLVNKLNERLGDSRIKFYISIHGIQELHDKMVGAPGHFHKQIDSIKLLKKYEVNFAMGFVPTRHNIHQLKDVLALAIKARATMLNISQFVPIGRGQEKYNLTKDEYRELLEWIRMWNTKLNHRYIVTHEHWISIVDSDMFNDELFIGCSAGIYYFSIRSNGDIVPCQLNSYVLDNIHNTRLIEVWRNNPTLIQLRKRRFKGKCGECPFLYKCGGCRCNAVAYERDILGEDPLCPFSLTELKDQYVHAMDTWKTKTSSARALGPKISLANDTRWIKVANLATSQGDALVIRSESTDAFVKLTGDARILYELLPMDHAISLHEIKTRFVETTAREMPTEEFSDLVWCGLIKCSG